MSEGVDDREPSRPQPARVLWLVASLFTGVGLGASLGSFDDVARELGPVGGSALVLVGLVWVAVRAWLDVLDDDWQTRAFRTADQLVKLAVPMVAVGAAIAVLTQTWNTHGGSQGWATFFIAVAVALVAAALAATARARTAKKNTADQDNR